MKPARGLAVDVAIACGLAAVVAALYAYTVLGCIYANDGAMLADWTALPERAYRQYHNTLYLPIADIVAAVVPPGLLGLDGDPLATAKATSVVCMALGLAFVFGCCRLLGQSRAASVLGTALLAVTPVTWFFAAAIEVHAQHFLVVSAAAFVTLLLPWRRPVLATALAALVFVLPCMSHQTAPVLGPGWVLLAQCARRRCAPPLSWRALAGVGGAFVAAIVVAHVLVQAMRGEGLAPDPGWVASTALGWRRAFVFGIVRDAVVLPLVLLLPIVLVAACWRRVAMELRAVAAALLLPLVGSVLWWGIAERGGYLLGPMFVAAVLAAAAWSALPARAAVAVALVLLPAQAVFGWRDVRAFDAAGAPLVDRVVRIREHLGETGLLVSANDNAPNAIAWLPRVNEINLFPMLAKPIGPTEAVQAAQPLLEMVTAAGRALFDTSWRSRTDLPEYVVAALSALEAKLRADFRVTELPDPSWPFLRLERR